MLSKEDNDLMTRVGPGTPMGNLLRQYWIPAYMPSELAADGPPMRLRLLGENLIAFRTTSGKAGIIQNACPHRGASLFFGRNEEEGLRCVYHGWKFDTTGQCIDMPSEPAESNFKSKIRASAYPCAERNGIVWTYMGPRETPPPLPELFPNLDEQCNVWLRLEECSFMQALEGDIDTVHAFFLHSGHVRTENTLPGSMDYYITKQREARFEAREIEIGATYAAIRDAELDTEYWRMGHYLLPFFTMNAPGLLGIKNSCIAWVPLDDHNTMVWNIGRLQVLEPETAGIGGLKAGFNRQDPIGKYDPYGVRQRGVPQRKFQEQSSDWLGRFRPIANKDNDYLIDRDLQAAMGTYSGVPNPAQDPMAQETMGPIYDRTQEHLATSDNMIIRTRRKLINAAKALRDQQTVPPGVDQPELYRMRGGGALIKRGLNGIDATWDVHTARATTIEPPVRIPAQ
jgi:nitrite reductase/ring-hydroxylating ferredoxin subunit